MEGKKNGKNFKRNLWVVSKIVEIKNIIKKVKFVNDKFTKRKMKKDLKNLQKKVKKLENPKQKSFYEKEVEREKKEEEVWLHGDDKWLEE